MVGFTPTRSLLTSTGIWFTRGKTRDRCLLTITSGASVICGMMGRLVTSQRNKRKRAAHEMGVAQPFYNSKGGVIADDYVPHDITCFLRVLNLRSVKISV